MVKVFVGPFDGIMTGQRHCLEVAADALDDAKRISVGGEGYGAARILMYAVLGMVQSLTLCVTQSERVLFLTPSRSVFGFVRDLMIVWPFLLFKSEKIAHWHGATIDSLKSSHPKVYQLFIRVYRKFDIHIVLTEGMRSQVFDFVENNGSRIEVVSNFHDFSNSTTIRRVEKPLKVLYLSNVMYEKGAFDFINLCSRVLKGYDSADIEFHLAGPLLGVSSQELGDAIADAGLEVGQAFYVHGGVYGKEKIDLLEKCDIFVFPSFHPGEAFPLVVLEAMAKGMCVISYDHNYMSDILKNECGILVKKGDVDGLVKAILDLSNDERLLQLKKHKCLELSKSYSKEKYVGRIRALLSFKLNNVS